MDNIIVGIDLGTTFSSVAYVDETGRPKAITNEDGKNATPSVVQIDNGQVSAVGETAMNQWITDEEHVVRWIKRSMGDDLYRFQGLSAVEISAEILKTLKADAERHFGHPVTEAVITCPAYFNASEIANTKRAGELAGFNVEEIIKEPTAAAVYYGVDHMRDGEVNMVCDLGGGTYDATILALENRVFTPRTTTGDRKLGGHDWTMELVDMVAERFQENFSDDIRNDLIAGQMLYESCEAAKRSFKDVTQVSIPCRYQGRLEQITVTRDEFEARTEWRITQLVTWCDEALKKAGLRWADIWQVLLVGGSSRLRRMALALAAASGKTPVQTGEPDLMVAYGAAIMGAGQVRPRKPAGGLLDPRRGALVAVEYNRIIARSLGTRVIVCDGDNPRIMNSLIIPHSTNVAESGLSQSRDDFVISSHGQEYFDVPVVEFEDETDYDVHRNFRFRCPANAQKGDRITVTFHYDKSAIITAEAVDQKNKQRLPVEELAYVEPNVDDILRLSVRPRWVVYAIDVSGSMEGVMLENAKRALLATAEDLLKVGGGEYKIGVVSFSVTAQIVCRPTTNMATLRQEVEAMATESTTATDLGIDEAVGLVLGAPAGTDRDVVLLTDGRPDTDRRQLTLDAAAAAKRKGVTLSMLGVGSGVDEDFLKTLTPLTLVIDSATGMSGAMTTLLTQSAAARNSGLMHR